MANVLFGGLYVPIVATVELTGTPAQHPMNAVLTAVYNSGVDQGTIYEHGIAAGFASASSTHGGTLAPVETTSCYVPGGRTSLHDSTELIVDVDTVENPPMQDSYQMNAIIVHTEGETTTQVDASSYSMICNAVSSASNRSIANTTRLFAVAYSYPEAPSEWEQKTGYMIGLATRSKTIYDDGRITETITVSTGASWWISIPYINRVHSLETWYDAGEEPEDPFNPSDEEPYIIPPGGRDDTSDTIGLPTDPPIGVTSVGFINVYKPGIGALQNLGNIIFPNVASATDIVDAVIKLCETMANSNLINYVIDCHVIPVTPTTGTNEEIKVGFRNTGISVPSVISDYANISCGALNIPEYFRGFQDYQGTRSKIYLPFIGFVDTKPEYWQAGTIAIDYKFNIIDGSFMAYIRSTSSKSQLSGSVIAQYSGNACMHFPLTGVNYANMVSGIIGAGIAAASTGGASAALGAAMSAANTIAQGGDVQQSNGYNSTSSILGVRVPYLLIERAVPSYSSGYRHDKGYPSNIYAALSNITGFTVIEDIDLSGIPLTDTELTELRSLLADGVYF